MESILKSIARPMQVEGREMSAEQILQKFGNGEEVVIKLEALRKSETVPSYSPKENSTLQVGRTYRIKVRQYMTKPATPDFDFQDKWNEGIPMPFRIMTGVVLKETKGMVRMQLHAEPMETSTCMACGRRLTHPVSRLYGIGPECGGHAHINPFNSEEELYAALDTVRAQLAEIKWEGWIIKSAIEESEEVTDG